ncbi:MAG: hypothetical protein JWR62_977 [Modestobacter sp.]|jgi:hypothetical protein|nr:hypothetical protein [Modestobacter sp.]
MADLAEVVARFVAKRGGAGTPVSRGTGRDETVVVADGRAHRLRVTPRSLAGPEQDPEPIRGRVSPAPSPPPGSCSCTGTSR